MKILHIPAEKTNTEPINKESLDKLPKTLFITYTIQYLPIARKIFSYLKGFGYNIMGFKQVLGCTELSRKQRQCPILLIGSGRFHALNLALQTDFPVYLYNRAVNLIDKQEMQDIKKKRQTALLKFLNAKNIGILISIKPGQNKIKQAKILKKKLENKGKSVYLFISNEINAEELENFKIDSWINTACPGLFYDIPNIVNLSELSSVNF